MPKRKVRKSKRAYLLNRLPHFPVASWSEETVNRMYSVVRMTPKERFFYWIKERHNIYVKAKKQKLDPPWTVDHILQTEFFTNPYRENDRVTVWFRENIREPMRDMDEVLFATVAFRWFNKPDPTGLLFLKHGFHIQWKPKLATRVIAKANESGPVFTGAYMIKAGNGPRGCKVPNVCEAITNVWKARKRLVKVCKDENSMEALYSELKQFPHLGGFMSYEVVCDLRYTALLEDATDINTWSNLGPGASRGLMRLSGQEIKVPKSGMKDARPKPPADWLKQFMVLRNEFNKVQKLKGMKRFEMREIEHSLCEYDKFERVLFDQGRSKRKYRKGT